jgi:hypothetical protein
MAFLCPPSKCRDSTSIRPGMIPSKSLLIHHSPILSFDCVGTPKSQLVSVILSCLFLIFLLGLCLLECKCMKKGTVQCKCSDSYITTNNLMFLVSYCENEVVPGKDVMTPTFHFILSSERQINETKKFKLM